MRRRADRSHAVQAGSRILATAFLLVAVSTPGWTANGPPATFASAEQAVDALVTATRNTRLAELRQILGTEGRALIWSGDRVADRVGRDKFIAAYDRGHRLEITGSTRGVLIVGPEQWPFPIPLVRDGTGWHFDTPAGVQEILNRRVGRNELNVIEVCRAFVVAQREYAARDPMGSGLAEFAQKFLSTAGARDGLYWPTQPGEQYSPLGPLRQRPAPGLHGRGAAKPLPYHGYYYRMLTGQGADAPGGAHDYIVDGHLSGGFALVAYPAQCGESGIMTFLVNQTGVVYQKNLGPDTPTIAAQALRVRPGCHVDDALTRSDACPSSSTTAHRGRGPEPPASDAQLPELSASSSVRGLFPSKEGQEVRHLLGGQLWPGAALALGLERHEEGVVPHRREDDPGTLGALQAIETTPDLAARLLARERVTRKTPLARDQLAAPLGIARLGEESLPAVNSSRSTERIGRVEKRDQVAHLVRGEIWSIGPRGPDAS